MWGHPYGSQPGRDGIGPPASKGSIFRRTSKPSSEGAADNLRLINPIHDMRQARDQSNAEEEEEDDHSQ